MSGIETVRDTAVIVRGPLAGIVVALALQVSSHNNLTALLPLNGLEVQFHALDLVRVK